MSDTTLITIIMILSAILFLLLFCIIYAKILDRNDRIENEKRRQEEVYKKIDKLYDKTEDIQNKVGEIYRYIENKKGI